jgi:prepilin peptidase CpaA
VVAHPFLVAAVVVTAVGGAIDLRTGQIPNALSLGALAAALVAHAVLGATDGGAWGAAIGFGASAFGAILAGLAPLLLFSLGAMGGGDVKLLAALGAIAGPLVGLEAELYAFVAAALFAPIRLAYDGKLLRTLGNTVALVVNPLRPKAKRRALPPEMMSEMRFGPAIFAGALGAALANWGAP